jgi:hypothetical protein
MRWALEAGEGVRELPGNSRQPLAERSDPTEYANREVGNAKDLGGKVTAELQWVAHDDVWPP